MIDSRFWKNKNVFITGHTGFKGSWLCIWLAKLGAKITGYALNPPTNPNLFELAKIHTFVNSTINDIRNISQLKTVLEQTKPEIVFHLAAQPLVRQSYLNPVETYETNVIGTVHLLEAIRSTPSVRSILIITSDKCYENKEWHWGYRENESMGGYDPYSSSKGCAELIVSAYRHSFFNPRDYCKHSVAIASARAGNVIGGGDWATDRLIPDCIKAILRREPVLVRNPYSIRPWQHVLEPLSGYLLLAQKLFEDGLKYGKSWNFGPNDEDAKPVQWIVETLCKKWGKGASYNIKSEFLQPHEACYLKLDCSQAKAELKWQPRWKLDFSLEKIVHWNKEYSRNVDILKLCDEQILEYCLL